MEDIIRRYLKMFIIYAITLFVVVGGIRIFLSSINSAQYESNQDRPTDSIVENQKNNQITSREIDKNTYIDNCIQEYKKRITIQDSEIQSNARKNLAGCFEKEKMYNQALKIYAKNYNLSKSKENFISLANCIVALGDLTTLREYLEDYKMNTDNPDDPDLSTYSDMLK